MHISFKHLRIAAMCLLLCAACCIPALAAEVDCDAVYCFSAGDFTDGLDGIMVTAVPDARIGAIRCGGRTLKPGDVMPAGSLSDLALVPACTGEADAVMTYLPITAGKIGERQAITISIRPAKDEPPVAVDSTMETYKNIANTGKLDCSDPEGGMLVYTITREPKRGTIVIESDGTFTYTPKKNKVGSDSFTYTATDEAGNTSSEAKVSIEILKPDNKSVYSDMTGDDDLFEAMWLKDQGVFSGERIAGELCFCPDKTVTRGEFLAMTMRLLGIETNDAALTSGFADEAQMPEWLRSYVVSAFRTGIVNGVQSEDGLVFRANAGLTKAGAAVIVQNILDLPAAQKASTTEEEALPAWCAASIIALRDNGIYDCTNAAETMTRREVANLLYQLSRVTEDQSDLGLLAWAAE